MARGQKNDIRRKQAINGQCVSDKGDPELLVLALRLWADAIWCPSADLGFC